MKILGITPKSKCERVLLRSITELIRSLNSYLQQSNQDPLKRRDMLKQHENKISILVQVFAGTRSDVFASDHPETKTLIEAIKAMKNS